MATEPQLTCVRSSSAVLVYGAGFPAKVHTWIMVRAVKSGQVWTFQVNSDKDGATFAWIGLYPDTYKFTASYKMDKDQWNCRVPEVTVVVAA